MFRPGARHWMICGAGRRRRRGSSMRSRRQRRRLPMVQMDDYTLIGADGPIRLVDIFDGRSAAHRLQPHVGRRRGMAVRWLHQPHVAVHPTRLPRQLRRPVRRSSPTVPSTRRWPTGTKSAIRWIGTPRRRVRSAPTSTRPPTQGFGFNVFLRDGDAVYRTWHTNGRGVEQLSYTFPLKDILPWGRQEEWLDSPQGWPSRPTYSGWLDSPDVARLYGSGG